MGVQRAATMSATRVISGLAAVLLLTAVLVVVLHDDQSQQYSSAGGVDSTSELAAVATTKLLNDDPNRCANVMDWNFLNAKVTQNNLGGVGPDSGAREIRYAGVSNGIDLILTTDAAYVVNPKVKEYEIDGVTRQLNGAGNNGVNGKFGQVNIKGNTDVKLKFTLVEAGTDIPADVAPEQTIFFSVYDLDTNGPSGYEFVDFTTPVDSYSVTKTTTARIQGNDAHLVATALRKGDDSDNPTDPLSMTQVQLDSAIWITYKGRNTWGMTFGEKGNKKGKGGRNLLFAGRAQGDCPDTCGGPAYGGPAKFTGAPYACGGPNCEKGADGKMNDFRYKNCCVGKPVTGGTSKATINAPYGIVSQKRFCSWGGGKGGLGADGPPCINKLPKV